VTFSQQQEFVPIHYMRWECPWEKTSTVERLTNFTFDDQRHNTLSVRSASSPVNASARRWSERFAPDRCGEYV